MKNSNPEEKIPGTNVFLKHPAAEAMKTIESISLGASMRALAGITQFQDSLATQLNQLTLADMQEQLRQAMVGRTSLQRAMQAQLAESMRGVVEFQDTILSSQRRLTELRQAILAPTPLQARIAESMRGVFEFQETIQHELSGILAGRSSDRVLAFKSIADNIYQNHDHLRDIISKMIATSVPDVDTADAADDVAEAVTNSLASEVRELATAASDAPEQQVADALASAIFNTVVRRLPRPLRRIEVLLNIAALIVAIVVPIVLAGKSGRDDRNNVAEITKRLDTTNRLLGEMIGEFTESYGRNAICIRLVERRALLRIRPSSKGAILTTVPAGVVVAVTQTHREWALIYFEDTHQIWRMGWVLKKYLD